MQDLFFAKNMVYDKKEERMFFAYGKKELAYLKKRDKALAKFIAERGFIERKVEPNTFAALI